jgi:hypothetical protein
LLLLRGKAAWACYSRDKHWFFINRNEGHLVYFRKAKSTQRSQGSLVLWACGGNRTLLINVISALVSKEAAAALSAGGTGFVTEPA